ncbi:hypothetical protein BKA00_005070 [Actinomadura coerulea]|uniref:DUF4386 family protein n=1 Tax=Actinomadura coerulea TaxID=46159 RepID=A0A7X0G4G2_9ACTN|nr:hypothetical protein [Actinomadura coerulea]MBB6398156.1 hypothetical protein [Actinomadura coerulea]GGQ35900.1 hypothetical protein GCM10010187_61650 [Actinomadura coerulea]
MTRIAFHLAPALMLAYGVVRLIDGRDGQHGPGPAWTVGHLLFLGSLLLYGSVIAGLWGRMPAAERGRARRITAGALTAVAAVGLVTFVRVAIIDIVVGLRAADAAEKSALSDRYADVPAVLPQALYEIGPVLFMLGLTALLVQHAVVGPRRWAVAASPVLLVLAFVGIAADLDLLPAGAALIWLALFPHTREQSRPAPAHRRAEAPATA